MPEPKNNLFDQLHQLLDVLQTGKNGFINTCISSCKNCILYKAL